MAFLGDPTFDYLKKALDIAVLRQDVIASNIANADTPGYKAKHIPFKDVLNLAEEDLKLKITSPRQIENSSDNLNYLVKESNQDYLIKNDKNNVKLDEELADLAKNTLLVNALTAFERYKFNEYDYVITSSKNI